MFDEFGLSLLLVAWLMIWDNPKLPVYLDLLSFLSWFAPFVAKGAARFLGRVAKVDTSQVCGWLALASQWRAVVKS